MPERVKLTNTVPLFESAASVPHRRPARKPAYRPRTWQGRLMEALARAGVPVKEQTRLVRLAAKSRARRRGGLREAEGQDASTPATEPRTLLDHLRALFDEAELSADDRASLEVIIQELQAESEPVDTVDPDSMVPDEPLSDKLRTGAFESLAVEAGIRKPDSRRFARLLRTGVDIPSDADNQLVKQLKTPEMRTILK